jgi:hypothetical protein
MTIYIKVWGLIALWVIGGSILMLPWAFKFIGDELVGYIFSWMIIIAVLNFLLIRCPQCGTSAYFVRRFIYRGWPNRNYRECGGRIM